MKYIVTLAVLLSIVNPSFCATTTRQSDWHALLDYSTMQPAAPSVYIFEPQQNKKLIYIAVEHVNDLTHPIVQEIRTVFAQLKPDFCVLEGFHPEEGLNPKRILEIADMYLVYDGRCTENLVAAKLCVLNDIPFIGGDVHNMHYLALMNQGYSECDIVFWMLAQNFPFWNRDFDLSDEKLFVQIATNMLQTHIPSWLNAPEFAYTLDEFLVWHEAHMGKPLDAVHDFPWGYDRQEFTPSLAPDATIYQKIQAHIMPIRDRHIVHMLQDAVEKYDTVLTIFGASHYEWQKAALITLFGEPNNYLISKESDV